MWESREAFQRGVGAGQAAIAGDPFDVWETGEVQVFSGESVV
jgi:hypothetical protein